MQMINAFRAIIVKAGYKFGIYCGESWYNTYLPDSAKKYDCWIAHYPDPDNGTMQTRVKPKAGIGWQYSSKATIPGIPTKVDRSVFYKDYSSINNANNSTTNKQEGGNKLTKEQGRLTSGEADYWKEKIRKFAGISIWLSQGMEYDFRYINMACVNYDADLYRNCTNICW